MTIAVLKSPAGLLDAIAYRLDVLRVQKPLPKPPAFAPNAEQAELDAARAEWTAAKERHRLNDLREKQDFMLKRAGLTAEEWNVFTQQLAQVDGRVWRRALAALGLHVEVKESPTPLEDLDSTPAGHIHSHIGGVG